jgi:signal transduction histidine kinase
MQGWRQPAGLGMAATMLGGCAAGSADNVLDTGFGIAALLLAAAAGACIAWLLSARRHRRELHDARQEARLLARLAGGQVWRSTPGRPPAEAPWPTEAMKAPEPLPALVTGVAGVTGNGAPREWRAEPWFDDQGRFAGHLGLVRDPVAVAAPPGHAQGVPAVLPALVEALPLPLALLGRQEPEGAWRVLQANAGARERLGSSDQLSPAALAQAEAEGWQWRPTAADGTALGLLWRCDAPAADEQAAFSYTVSHDLRAPIRVVEGFTRIVKEDYGPGLDRIANDHLDRVLGAAARMNQMIDAMLTLARLSSQPLARQPVNLSQLASYVIDDLKRGAPERQASIVIEAGMTTPGDPTLLRLVLENLLGNAWKYSARRAQTHITFGRETVDGRSVFVVRDNGAGFDMRSAERLFGLFQRLHSASDFAGTGVGLASVRRIVQRHGGEIWADGEPGRGAAFFFTLRG